jgi:hypothetical protein
VDTHPSEEDLILHFYGEGRDRAADEAEIDAHLRVCPSCQLTWTELRETLALVDAAAVPEPGPAFERTMWARVQAALQDEQPATSRWRLSWWLSPAIGVAAVLAILVGTGRLSWPRNAATSTARVTTGAAAPAIAHASTDQARSHERVLLTALDSHFQRSEMLLVEVMNGPDKGGHDLAFERETAGDLLDSSRLYRTVAEQNGDVRLARMLEDMESVLVEIARSSDVTTRKDVAALRARIDDDDLLFKVRAVTNQIHQRLLSTE